MKWIVKILYIIFITCIKDTFGNPHAKRLYDDLLNNYNRLIRPVSNNTEKLTVKLGLKLSQLIDVDLKNQIMTTNVWVVQKWRDYKLQWNPDEYGGVEMMYVPSQNIWLPDIVLFNNADGKYEVTLMTKASLNYTGEVVWKPPAIYKSSCKINVEWFPFDEQSCDMKFGSWTYDGYQVDLKHIDQEKGSNVVDVGIDLKEFYLSVEWDILAVPATRNEEYFAPHAQIPDDEDDEASLQLAAEHDDSEHVGKLLTDITFIMTLRRKTLFYTVNLIIPCVGISFLTVLVFYLPSDSGEKVTLCVSILLSLTVFFLLLAEIIPPTSLAVPLLGKYLLFTMILVTLSICVTVGVLNIHFRSPSTHRMSPWARKIFIHVMPRILLMQRPNYMPRYSNEPPGISGEKISLIDNTCGSSYKCPKLNGHAGNEKWPEEHQPSTLALFGEEEEEVLPPEVNKYKKASQSVKTALRGVEFIAQHIKNADKDNEVIEDWKFIAMVLDRLFLWLFTAACLLGTAGIIFRAPSLYDMREPIDAKLSEIPKF